MPVMDGRYDKVKVSRPGGTKYAQGSAKHLHHNTLTQTATEAIAWAVAAFIEEFGQTPVRDFTVIEVVCDSFDARATVFELPDGRS